MAGGAGAARSKHFYAFVALPGGLGTLDELSEALTLIQTGKIRNFPIALIGRDYWQPFERMLKAMAEARTIGVEDPVNAKDRAQAKDTRQDPNPLVLSGDHLSATPRTRRWRFSRGTYLLLKYCSWQGSC